MGWPRSFIDQVRRSADPVRIVGEVVNLKKRGARWVGLCPFHQEKTPSFTVNEEGLWYCFGCSEGGDLFKFVMRHEGLDFPDAVRSIAERCGIEVPKPSSAPSDARRGPKVDRRRLLEALEAAQEHYRRQLAASSGARAREYLDERGLTEATIERFALGYAPPGWDSLLRHMRGEGYSPDELEAAGLVKRRADGSGVYDLLRERIVFPIRDLRGRTVAFGGRVLEEGEPKYLNSPETSVYHKGRTLYGLGEGRKAIRDVGFVLLVEGYLDLLACAEHGFANVVAPLGTSFTAEQARALAHHADKAVIAFDGDDAGRAAAERTVGTFLAAGFQVSVVDLPAGQDPDSLLAAEGREALATALRRAMPALSFLVQRAGHRGDLRSPQGKARALESLLGFVVEIEDRVERAEWIGRIAEAVDVAEHLVRQKLGEVRDRARSRSGGAAGSRGRESAAGAGGIVAELEQPPRHEKRLLVNLLERPAWVSETGEIIELEDLRDGRIRDLVGAIRSIVDEGRVEGDARLPIDDLVRRLEVEGADTLLSRVANEPPLDSVSLEGLRGCLRAIKRDSLERRRRAVIRAMEDPKLSQEELDELAGRHLEIKRELDTIERQFRLET